MATAAPQTAMEMPQEAGANPFADPNTMAVYDQLRQTMSPKEFGDEMLAGASQVDPEAMAQFREELSQIDLSPEELDMLNNMVDEILATPEQYAAVRAKYLEMGAPEELLPEEFDPQFFAAMNMAVDQLIAEPAGVQAFAMGGIAELKPIAKAIAGYGRNGDTMLAHITPAEARMLRRRGGSGTINPATGLPEFFLKKAFKSIGKAVKKFANSTIGKIVLPIALGFFLGPAAASFMNVTSAAGVAAVGGFIGGAGSTLLAGGNLKDALKAGAIGGLTVGAGTAIGGAIGGTNAFASGSYTGPTTIGGQVDRFTNFISPSASASGIQAPAIDASGQVKGLTTIPEQTINPLDRQYATPAEIARVENINPANASDATLARQQSLGVSSESQFTPKKISLVPGPDGTLQVPPGSEVRPFTSADGRATSMGTFPTNPPVGAPYDPATATRAVDYGYKPGGETSFMDKIKSGYNEYFSPSGIQEQAAPQARQAAADAVAAAEKTLPASITGDARAAMLKTTYDNALKTAMPGAFATYAPITALGLGAVGLAGGFKATDAQPSAMQGELMKPVTQRIAEGGNQKAFYMQGLPGVKYDQYGAPIFGQNVPLPTFDTGLGIQSLINPKGFSTGGAATTLTAEEKAAADKAAADKAAADKAEAEKTAAQAANRKLVEDAKAAEKAAGFGNAYKNINAGLSYDVPAGVAATSIAARQAAFKPTMDRFTQAQAANAATLAQPYTPRVVTQPYNNASGYGNVINKPVLPPVNYDTTPVITTPVTPGPNIKPPVKQPPVKAITNKQITDYLVANPNMSDAQIRAAMDQYGVGVNQMAEATGSSINQIQNRYDTASKFNNQDIQNYLASNANMSDRAIYDAMNKFGVGTGQMAAATNLPMDQVQARYDYVKSSPTALSKDQFNRTILPSSFEGETNPFRVAQLASTPRGGYSNQDIQKYLSSNPTMTDAQIRTAMDQFGVGTAQMAAATNLPMNQVEARYKAALPTKLMNMGGIASLGSGGYPRRTGQINGPGTATSDSIPAMLSDGEFVMTAKAVRGAGKGNRRAGAKRMYALMNQLEKNAARG